MTEPANVNEPVPAAPQRYGTIVLVTAVALIAVAALVVTTPFWGPVVMRLLPWGQPLPGVGVLAGSASPKPVAPATATPAPAAPDPALAALRAEAAQNAATLQQLGQRVAAAEARPAPDLAPIQQQLTALTKTTADLSAGIAALQREQEAERAADPKNTALALVLLQIRAAVDLARPFEAEYQALVALARDHPEIAAAAAPLAGPAASGVPSRAALAERLRQLAPQIATAKPPAKASWKSQIVARLRALVTIRRIDGEMQNPAQAAVSTAQRAMASGDLDGAVAALSGLAGANAAAAEPWLAMARQRLAVEAALRQLEAAITAALGQAPPGKG
jgi:uroporphyrinogen-III synthase